MSLHLKNSVYIIKRHWQFPEEILVPPLSKGELRDGILEQGNIKRSLDPGPLLLLFMSKLKFTCKVQYSLLSKPSYVFVFNLGLSLNE